MSRGLINKLFNDVQQLLHMVIPVILQNVILCRYPIMLVSHARGMLHRWRRRCRQHHSCKRTFRARNRLPTSSRFQRLLRCQNLQHAVLVRVGRQEGSKVGRTWMFIPLSIAMIVGR